MISHETDNARCVLLLVFLTVIGTARASSQPADTVEFFENHVRPILADHCYDCHGEVEASGKLRLDLKSGWERGGEAGPAIVPGDPSSSLLVRAVSWRDQDLKMPPEEAGGKLSDKDIAVLTEWIRNGAVDPRTGEDILTDIDANSQTHWAFQPLNPPQIPDDVHPVDFLIRQKLSDAGFVSTERADPYTLLRRATFDLLGLPPTSEQKTALREGFSELIRQLLASPRYGERWGRHWLDVARYSDAKDGVLMYGDERIRPFAYTYRDYVVRSFNHDKPFDEFIREQLAADQLSLPENSPDLAAMGFLTLGPMFDKNRHDVIDDQIDVVTRGFLGLTVSCARCHDHKFDPVPTADYYSLYGVFASSIEPYHRPRIADVLDDGRGFEQEYSAKLREVRANQERYIKSTLNTARDRTPDYLVRVATTEPDIDETSIFFLSLVPEQLRPGITWRWRQLVARRAFPDDPVFGPWHDLMQSPVLRAEEWRERGVDSRIIDGLIDADPKTPEQIARTYGQILRSVWDRERQLTEKIDEIDARLATLNGDAISIADLVGGGNGVGSGKRGRGIQPATGEFTDDQAEFVSIERFDQLIEVPDSEFIDGVFVPKTGTATISSSGHLITGTAASSGQTWDYFRFGPIKGATSNSIDGIDYSVTPNRMLGMHANKGITFDIQAMRAACVFGLSRFETVFGHAGAAGESQLNLGVYLDGRKVLGHDNVRAQQVGVAIDVEIPEDVRFLTLVVTEGSLGISHDQAIFGNPQIVPQASAESDQRRRAVIADLKQRRLEFQTKRHELALKDDSLGSLLVSRKSPVWFPREDLRLYLSRFDKIDFEDLVSDLDAIAVKHQNAPSRAMVLVDSEVLYEPVIFQRGDPGQRGTPVDRRFLKVLSVQPRKKFPDGSGRRNLADAIVSADNPLTARVWVNRVWMHHFGEPLVENPGDFGLRTEQPMHHELLDYLADSFIKNGWRTKPLHELIMSSQAYQRASRIPETIQMARQLEADPRNEFLWHANRRRLDFEQMRDTLLVVSGQLDATMYGRPLLITDPENTRRTIYAFVERQNIPAMVQTFDFANADTSTSRRVNTTVPQQALFAMNSAFMARAAAALGKAADGFVAPQKVNHLYSASLGRSPSNAEFQLAMEFLTAGSTEQLAQVLLMSNELMFVD
ncbi:MAG: DUF1553 domain-containing protein [Fuerstiella sp.]|nr:DUF1553 domain-containing protein [Fuerstiella sp.]